ncbi:MAG: hypothetical protein ABIC19_02345 [Patescibacteria group bacterium]|nr:hypothetical protein [Patescibacteria group bacterium]
MKDKKIIVLAVLTPLAIIALASTFSFETPAAAKKNSQNQNTNQTNQPGNEQTVGQNQEKAQPKQERKENQEEIRQRNCQNIQSKIQNRINRYENYNSQNRNRFHYLKTRLEKFTADLKARDYDVSQIEQDLKILDEKIQKLNNACEEFINQLKQAQDYSCNKSREEFKNSLNRSVNNIPGIHQYLADIKNFYKDTIRPDILTLRNQKSTLKNQSKDQEPAQKQ